MALMIPPSAFHIGDPQAPRGELDVFEKFKNNTPEDWVVLHSLRLKKHEYKKSGEADFVVITHKGILVIEVKGGKNYRNEKGEWVQTRYGSHDRISNEGPFKQAKGAYFAIEKYIKDSGRKELIERLPWGWGVIMPHCVLNCPNDPEIDSKMLLDQRFFPEGLVGWVNDLIEFWREDTNLKKYSKLSRGRKMQDSLGSSTRDELNKLLRPQFECYTGLGQAVREAEQNLIRLTERQCHLLNAISSKSTPRVIIEGAAGTGKTLLALEFAKECAKKNERVLLVCYNANLARLLKTKVNEMPTIAIYNYHQLVKELRLQAGLHTTFSSDWEDFNKCCFDLVVEALDRLGDDVLFDRIIVDEGQDLMSDTFLDVLDLLLKDGLTPPVDDQRKGGRWLFAMDVAQALYTNNCEEQALERLRRCCGSTLELVENCRNTRPVAQHVYGFSRSGSCDVMIVEGPSPVIDYFSNQKDFIALLRKYINSTLVEYARVDQPASDIAILTARKDLIPDAIFEPGLLSRPLKRYRDAKKNDVVWETIHGFKGLEATTVILVGVEDMEREIVRQLMYVGGSRARVRLIWLLPENHSNMIQEGLLAIQKNSLR